MIAILTKYEALVDRVKDKYGGRSVTPKEVLNYAKENVINPLKNVTHVPMAIVQTHCMFLLSITFIITIMKLLRSWQRL